MGGRGPAPLIGIFSRTPPPPPPPLQPARQMAGQRLLNIEQIHSLQRFLSTMTKYIGSFDLPSSTTPEPPDPSLPTHPHPQYKTRCRRDGCAVRYPHRPLPPAGGGRGAAVRRPRPHRNRVAGGVGGRRPSKNGQMGSDWTGLELSTCSHVMWTLNRLAAFSCPMSSFMLIPSV